MMIVNDFTGSGETALQWGDRMAELARWWSIPTAGLTWAQLQATMNGFMPLAGQIGLNERAEQWRPNKVNAFWNRPHAAVAAIMSGRNGFAVPILPGVNVWQDAAATVPALAVNDPVGAVTIPGTSTIALHQTALANRPPLGRVPKTGLRNRIVGSDAPATQTVVVRNIQHTLSFRGTGTLTLSGASTAGPLVGSGGGTIVSLTFTPSDGSLTLTVSGQVEVAQLEAGPARTAYQSRLSAHDVTEAGVASCWGLTGDGVTGTRMLVTPNALDLGAGQSALAAVAITKFSRAPYGAVIEALPDSVVTGSLSFGVDFAASTMSAGARSTAGGGNSTTVAAHITTSDTFSLSVDFGAGSSSEIALRRNAEEAAAFGTGAENTGTFASRVYTFGARSNGTFPFNGLIHGVALRGGAFSDAERLLLSRYLMQYTPGQGVL